MERVGFKHSYKTKKGIEGLGLYKKYHKEKFIDEIVSIKKIGNKDVFDCTILDAHEFDANGLRVHNCGEIAMSNDSCRLVALNMYNCVINPFTKDAYFDYDKWYEISYEGQRLNDDLVDLELKAIEEILKKIKNDPEPDHIKQVEIDTWEKLYEKGKNGRRTGLGFTALGDAVAALGLRYDSNKALEEVEKIMKQKCKAEFDSSIDMSIERGSFEGFDTKIEKQSHFVQMMKEEMPVVYKRMMKYGRRNISLSTVAPTGTLSLLAQTSSGIEPAFMLSYMRRRKINPNDIGAKVDFIDDLGDKWQEYEVFHNHFKTWKEISGKSEVEKSPYYKSTAEEIDWTRRIRMQSIIQKYVTHSISSTINLPEDVSVEKVGEIYMKSWEMGLKGVTVYRTGSRSGVLISKEEKQRLKEEKYFSEHNAPKRPKNLESQVIRFQNDGEKWIGFLGVLEGRPYEIFTGKLDNFPLPASVEEGIIRRSKVMSKDGNKISRYDFLFEDKSGEEILVENLSKSFHKDYWNYAKMISGVLRHGMPIPYAVELVNSLNLGTENLTTWKEGVKRMLKKFIQDGTKASNTTCSECKDPDGIIYEEGCLKCKSCGNTKCGG